MKLVGVEVFVDVKATGPFAVADVLDKRCGHILHLDAVEYLADDQGCSVVGNLAIERAEDQCHCLDHCLGCDEALPNCQLDGALAQDPRAILDPEGVVVLGANGEDELRGGRVGTRTFVHVDQ